VVEEKHKIGKLMKKLFLFLLLLTNLTLTAQSFMVPVNLQVDINQIENLGEDVIVSVRSNLTSWSPVGMDDSDGDGIYEKTINIGASVGQATEFVYVFRLQSIVNGLSIVQY